MISKTRQYSGAASHARNAVEKAADVWTEGARTVTDRLPGLPQIDLVPVVERYFDFLQRTVDINRHLAVRWAEAAGTLSGVVREKAGSAGDVVREKAEAAGDIAREQAVKAEQAAHEQAEKVDQAEKELARQVRQAEREQARQAHERARQRYEGLTKAQLSDLLAKRGLPKTGNIDELIERLVEADSR
jgi:SAP domain